MARNEFANVDGMGSVLLPDWDCGRRLRDSDELRPIQGMFSVVAVVRDGRAVGWCSVCDLNGVDGEPYQHVRDWIQKTGYALKTVAPK